MNQSKIILGVGLVAFLVISVVVYQNWTPLVFRFLFWHVEVSKSLAFLVLFALGFGLGWALRHFRAKK